MKVLQNFDDTLTYCNRLGFARGGNMTDRQQNLCNAVDVIEKLADNRYPIAVHFFRPLSDHGFYYATDKQKYGYFAVTTPEGNIRTQSAKGL